MKCSTACIYLVSLGVAACFWLWLSLSVCLSLSVYISLSISLSLQIVCVVVSCFVVIARRARVITMKWCRHVPGLLPPTCPLCVCACVCVCVCVLGLAWFGFYPKLPNYGVALFPLTHQETNLFNLYFGWYFCWPIFILVLNSYRFGRYLYIYYMLIYILYILYSILSTKIMCDRTFKINYSTFVLSWFPKNTCNSHIMYICHQHQACKIDCPRRSSDYISSS